MSDDSLHVVALSGGKDSTAMALRLRELNPDREYEYVCTPTGDELPEMHRHWQDLERRLGKKIHKISLYPNENGLLALIRDQKMIPNFRARFCTRMLKIEPMISWLIRNRPVTHYVGLRADEETRVGIYGDIEGVQHDYPMQKWGWGIGDVRSYLKEKGIEIPKRTDCALCFFQRLYEWRDLSVHHPTRYQAGVDIEAEVGHTFRSPQRDTWPAGLEGLRGEFMSGREIRGARSIQSENCELDLFCRTCSL